MYQYILIIDVLYTMNKGLSEIVSLSSKLLDALLSSEVLADGGFGA